MAWTVLTQVFILSLMILLGYILGKIGFIGKEHSRFLTDLVMDVFFPCNILYLLGGILRFPDDQRRAFACSVGYPNNGFMGLPLCAAVFGTRGVVWGSLGIPGATVYIFAVLSPLFQRSRSESTKEKLKSLVTPLNLSVLAMIIMMIAGLKLEGLFRKYAARSGPVIRRWRCFLSDICCQSRLLLILSGGRPFIWLPCAGICCFRCWRRWFFPALP